jgi:Clostripain family
MLTTGSAQEYGRPKKEEPVAGGSGSKKAWTVAVWVAGDNNLDSFGGKDLAELKQVGSTDDVAVVAQFDRAGPTQHTRRYVLQKGTTLEDDVVADLGETDTGDPQVAIDFFTWAMETQPSEKVLGVIWNHGSGIDETDIYARARGGGVPGGRVRSVATSGYKRALFSTTVDQAVEDAEDGGTRGIAYDDAAKDFLDNKELERVLAEVTERAGRRIDILGFDACLMNMVEVAYQLKGTVDYIVGSEETEPGNGWPYDEVLKTIVESPEAPTGDVAKKLAADYLQSYAGSGEAVTQSAVDVARVEDVATATKALADACIPLLPDPVGFAHVTRAAKNAQRYTMKDFADFGDLVKALGEGASTSDVTDAAKAVQDALFGESPFVLASEAEGATVSRSTGTAVYFPIAGDVHVVYGDLHFADASHWGNFISAYGQA